MLSCVDEDVRADLGEGRLKQDQVVVVGASAGALTQQVNRVVKRVQPILESGKRGVELKGL